MTASAARSHVNPPSRPAWLKHELYPFQDRWIDIDGNTVHYLDEGRGPALLLLHGNPTWSFLYRHIVAALPTPTDAWRSTPRALGSRPLGGAMGSPLANTPRWSSSWCTRSTWATWR
jgi:pimeloyl-ACP methyl ester carboxylesterase